MDLWVVAAAAGAGYIAKNLPNFSVEKRESLSGPPLRYSYNLQPESRNLLQQLRDRTCPLRRLAQKTVQDEIFSDLENHSSSSEKTRIVEDYGQQFGDGGNKNLSRISGGKMIGNRRRLRRLQSPRLFGSCMDSISMEQRSCLQPSMSAVRPVLVSDNKPSSPSLKELEPLEKIGKPEKSSGSSHQRGSGDGAAFGRSSPSQGAETMLLFISGMTVGILTATTSWRDEANELNTQLSQMQDLVQNMHEELDMKEMLMVKELDHEGDPPTGEEEEPVSYEKIELLSRIEAELQAELEMLENNINSSDREGISSFVEVDQDLEPEIVRGDLKATLVKTDASESVSTATDTTDCTKPANYAVPPWELSLRLHELIESRLETQIRELETALTHSENRVRFQQRRFSDSGTESSSAQHSPTCICDEHDRREDEPCTGDYGYISRHGVITVEDRSPNLVQDMLQIWDKQRMMTLVSNEDSMSEDDEGSDESEMVLIKQIIERRRSGSSFNLNID